MATIWVFDEAKNFLIALNFGTVLFILNVVGVSADLGTYQQIKIVRFFAMCCYSVYCKLKKIQIEKLMNYVLFIVQNYYMLLIIITFLENICAS